MRIKNRKIQVIKQYAFPGVPKYKDMMLGIICTYYAMDHWSRNTLLLDMILNQFCLS